MTGVPGFEVRDEFVTEELAAELVDIINDDALQHISGGSNGIDHVVGFLEADGAQTEAPLVLCQLVEKVAPIMGQPDSIIATRYQTGAYLDYHVDPERWSDTICILNLLSDFELGFMPLSSQDGSRIYVPMKARSLSIMGGPSRREFNHGIDRIMTPRIAVVMRRLKG